MEEPLCRICMGDASEGKLFSPCLCKGSMRYVHVECLQRWRKEKDKAVFIHFSRLSQILGTANAQIILLIVDIIFTRLTHSSTLRSSL